MRGIYKAACIIGIIGAYAISTFGCNNNEISKPDIQAQTIPLSEKVLNLSDDLFIGYYGSPFHDGALYIGKDQKGANRYAVISASKEDDFKGLVISVYSNLDPNVQAEVDKHLSKNRHKLAEELLSKTNGKIIQFRDAYADGLKATDLDVLVTRNEEGEYAQVNVSNLSEDELGKVKDVYASVLKVIEPVLQQELNARAERIAKIDQEIEEKRAAAKLQREATLDQRIENAMQNLTEFSY